MGPAPPPALPPALETLVYPGAAGESSRKIGGVRAVLFDIYGTLFTSSAGDIGVNDGYPRGNLDALALEYAPRYTGEELKNYFREAVLKRHEGAYARTPYPEVRVEEIWAAFLGPSAGERPGDPGDKEGPGPEELALRYELAVNPVYPMPGARELLRRLRMAGRVLGIISNAQFFTPLLFNAFLGGPPEELGFDPRLLIYSFAEGEAKPSPALFTRARDRLASLGIEPDACLYVGNDMLNDIYGAASAGFRTLLFAGDGRSLRLREGNALVRDLRPSGIIRHLGDLASVIGL
jgi:putative hydrolase of the HAD superfamily